MNAFGITTILTCQTTCTLEEGKEGENCIKLKIKLSNAKKKKYTNTGKGKFASFHASAAV
jgi:hypothetical protein